MQIELSDNSDVKSSLNKLRKDVLIYAPAILIPALLGLINIMFYTRLFSPNEYGHYSVTLNTTIFLATLMTQWIQQSIQKYRPYYQQNDRLPEFNANLKYLIYLAVTVVVCVGIFFIIFAPIINVDYKLIIISIFIVVLHMIYTLFSIILQSSYKSNEFRTFNLINSFVKSVIPLLLVFFVIKNVNMIFLGIIAGYLAVLIPMGKKTGIFNSREQQFNLFEFKKFSIMFMNYGFPMIGWFLGNSLLNLLDRYMLQSYWNDSSVGIYTATYSVVSASLGLFCTPLLMAAHPIIMNNSKDNNDDQISKVITHFSNTFLMIIFPAFALLSILSREVIDLLLGPEFQRGFLIFPLMLFGLMMWNFGMYGHKGYEIKNKTKQMLAFVIVCVGLNICLNFLLIPTYSFIGAAIASSISLSTYPILVFFFSVKVLPWKLKWKSILNVLISTLFASSVTFFMNNVINFILILDIIVSSILFIVIYLTGLIVLKEIVKEDLTKLLRIPLKMKGE